MRPTIFIRKQHVKKLVTEINRKALMKLLPLFGIESQITVIEDEPKLYDNPDLTEETFYIEETIVDLENVLSMCDDVDYAKTPIRKIVDWSEFCDFWKLILNIQKQREFGYPMTNIEYIYNKGLQLNLPIKLQRASVDLGFYPDINYFVITGQSEIGEMILYQDGDDWEEYVFLLQYTRVKKFSKKKVTETAHWHPRSYRMAIEDMVAFMNSDKEYFKRIKRLNLL